MTGWVAAAGTTHASQTILRLLRKTAADAAEAAGAVLKVRFGKAPRIEETLPHDLKLELDRICETRILSVVREAFPTHSILSEEAGYIHGSAPFVWIVDPVDGTVNYYHGLPLFCSSVACYGFDDGKEDGPQIRLPNGQFLGKGLVGVVHVPLADELYEGVAGLGATLNGEPLNVPSLAAVSEAVVGFALSAKKPGMDYATRVLPTLLDRARKVRCLGSTALEIVQVAAGRTGAFLQNGTNLWDFAAAAVILREAGGFCEAHEFSPGRFEVLAGNPGIRAELEAIVES